jgi:hypothetical protein
MLKPLSPLHSPQFMPRSREQLMLTAQRPRLTDTCRSVFKFPFLSLPMRRQWQYCAVSNVHTGFQPHNATSATPFWPLKTRRPCHFRSHSFQSPPRISTSLLRAFSNVQTLHARAQIAKEAFHPLSHNVRHLKDRCALKGVQPLVETSPPSHEQRTLLSLICRQIISAE